MKEQFIHVAQVIGVNGSAVAIFVANINAILTGVSVTLAIIYTSWKFYNDYQDRKKSKLLK